MTENEFWSLMNEARSKAGNMKSIPTWLEVRLMERSLAEINDFGAWLSHFMGQAHKAQLWNAGSIIAGGLSDDGFVYFKCWLISRGKDVYESALLDPDSLADLEYPDYQPERGFLGRPSVKLEKLIYVYIFACNKKCGKSQYVEVRPPSGWGPPVGCQPYGKLPKISHEDILRSDDVPQQVATFPRIMQRFPPRKSDCDWRKT